MTNLNLPKRYENIPELNDKFIPADGKVWTFLKLHRTSDGFIIYNPLSSIQFDIDLEQLPQLKAGKVGIVRWERLASYLYNDASLWYILAQLNDVIDPIAEIPERQDLIYYIEQDMLDIALREITINS